MWQFAAHEVIDDLYLQCQHYLHCTAGFGCLDWRDLRTYLECKTMNTGSAALDSNAKNVRHHTQAGQLKHLSACGGMEVVKCVDHRTLRVGILLLSLVTTNYHLTPDKSLIL